jgi:hypothetical protein
MRIVVFDDWNKKFSGPIIEHWESLGHTIRFNPTWEQAVGAELNFFYQASNTAVEGTTIKELTGKIFVQCVDIEVFAGQATAVNWEKVSGAIFMAKHIKNIVEHGAKVTCPMKIIRPGIDLTKWTLKPSRSTTQPQIKRIAYVVGDRRIWDVKRLDIAFQILRDLLDYDKETIWQLHVRGTYSSHEQYNAYCRYLEKDLKLEGFVVWHEERIEDLNKWLDDMDYFYLPSTKEAFSYATAEAMAKGIKPIINNWESSKENWAPFVCETYGQALAAFTKGDYTPEFYREYVERYFDQNRYFSELDEFILGGGETNG